jgi:hypothetical protein
VGGGGGTTGRKICGSGVFDESEGGDAAGDAGCTTCGSADDPGGGVAAGDAEGGGVASRAGACAPAGATIANATHKTTLDQVNNCRAAAPCMGIANSRFVRW